MGPAWVRAPSSPTEASPVNVRVPWAARVPGTGKLERLEENIGAVSVELSDADLREINESAARGGGEVPEQLKCLGGGRARNPHCTRAGRANELPKVPVIHFARRAWWSDRPKARTPT